VGFESLFLCCFGIFSSASAVFGAGFLGFFCHICFLLKSRNLGMNENGASKKSPTVFLRRFPEMNVPEIAA
jgi:hypothetical protein